MCMVCRGQTRYSEEEAMQRVCDTLYLHSSESRTFVMILSQQFFAYACSLEDQKAFSCHSFPNTVAQMKAQLSHLEYQSLKRIACCLPMHGTADALPWDMGSSWRANGSYSYSRVLFAAVPHRTSKGSSKESRYLQADFSVNISTFLNVLCVPVLLQTQLHQHKQKILFEQMLKSSANHV